MSAHTDEIRNLSVYLEGMADALATQPVVTPPSRIGNPFSDFRVSPAARLLRASQWLDKLSRNVCRHGYVGCMGGDQCTSDHK